MSQSCIKLHLPIHRGPSISQFFAISESFHFLVRVIKDQTADHTDKEQCWSSSDTAVHLLCCVRVLNLNAHYHNMGGLITYLKIHHQR